MLKKTPNKRDADDVNIFSVPIEETKRGYDEYPDNVYAEVGTLPKKKLKPE